MLTSRGERTEIGPLIRFAQVSRWGDRARAAVAYARARAAQRGSATGGGAVFAQGRDYREAFQEFRSGFDLDEEREQRGRAGLPERFGEADLYPDVREALRALRADGLWLGIAGNQTTRAGVILRELFTKDVDLIGTSDDWGASKPDPGFFRRVAEVTPFSGEEILYVGDRVDNDLLPARAAGMRAALIRRGPWALIQWGEAQARELPTFRVESLCELPGLIREVNGRER